MVPSVFVRLEALPLSPNGKVDRRRLPDPMAFSSHSPPSRLAAPRTPVEEVLAGIWAEVLRRGQGSVEDDFFEIGGPFTFPPPGGRPGPPPVSGAPAPPPPF